MSPVHVLLLLVTGGMAGMAAGFMGIGGGAILTPLCMLVYPLMGIHDDSLVRIIFGTNMFLVMTFSVSAVLRHSRNGTIAWRTVAILGPLAVIGSIAGGWTASVTDPAMLKKAFATLLLVSSTLIALRGSTKPSGGPRGGTAPVPETFLPVLGFVTGFMGSFLGIGGGVVMIPSLILLFAIPIERVAGTSSSLIIFIGLFGTVSYMFHGRGMVDLPGWSTGYVWWSAAIPLALGGVPMARVGVWINTRLRARTLQRMFGLILLVISLKMLFF